MDTLTVDRLRYKLVMNSWIISSLFAGLGVSRIIRNILRDDHAVESGWLAFSAIGHIVLAIVGRVSRDYKSTSMTMIIMTPSMLAYPYVLFQHQSYVDEPLYVIASLFIIWLTDCIWAYIAMFQSWNRDQEGNLISRVPIELPSVVRHRSYVLRRGMQGTRPRETA